MDSENFSYLTNKRYANYKPFSKNDFESDKDGSGDSNRDSWSDDSDRSERADYRRGGLDNEGFI